MSECPRPCPRPAPPQFARNPIQNRHLRDSYASVTFIFRCHKTAKFRNIRWRVLFGANHAKPTSYNDPKPAIFFVDSLSRIIGDVVLRGGRDGSQVSASGRVSHELTANVLMCPGGSKNGGGGNRTPVPRRIGGSFYVHSRFFNSRRRRRQSTGFALVIPDCFLAGSRSGVGLPPAH